LLYQAFSLSGSKLAALLNNSKASVYLLKPANAIPLFIVAELYLGFRI
jgi:hypothetical protein